MADENNFQIARLSSGDVVAKTDHLRNFENLILANEQLYPAIVDWYRTKVLSGIRHEERVAFVGYLDERPAISAVVRKGADAKFCHLKIHRDLQNAHLGELFFTIMALEVRYLARRIHFTLPESLWKTKEEFFKSFGFQSAEIAETQYRLFDRELECHASFRNVWQAIVEKLPKLSQFYGANKSTPTQHLLLSVKPKNGDQIISKTKTVEIRRKFSTRWIGHTINLYSSSPVMGLIGEARIARIVVDNPKTIWERYHADVGCTRSEFYRYAGNADSLYAIELEDIERYRSPVSMNEISQISHEHLVPPQSYCTLERNRPWAKAISIANYLGACAKDRMAFATNLMWSMRVSNRRPVQDEIWPTRRQVEFELH
jgi:predicted transcriptional regulator